MLKGKFYTGLPEKMMHRSQGVDRQRTQFYWPNDSDAEDRPVKNVKKNSASSSTVSTVANNTKNGDVEIKPKELFQKQLASGIEFYDNVNAKTPESRRRRFKKIENINLTNVDRQFVPEKKKLETFSSKIEFYDFVDDAKLKDNRNHTSGVKNSTKKVTEAEVMNKKLPERSDSMRKRISFNPEIATAAAAKKGILKNADNKDILNKGKDVVRTSAVKKIGLAKKSLSKSVENIPRLALDSDDDDDKQTTSDQKKNDLASVVRDVKNIIINDDKPKKVPQRSRYADFNINNALAPNANLKTNNDDSRIVDNRNEDDIRNVLSSRDEPKRNASPCDDYDYGDTKIETRHTFDKDSSRHNRKYHDEYYENRSIYKTDRNRRSPQGDDYEDARYENRRIESSSRYSNAKQLTPPRGGGYRNDDYYDGRSYNSRRTSSPSEYNRDYLSKANRRSSNELSPRSNKQYGDYDRINRYNGSEDRRKERDDYGAYNRYEKSSPIRRDSRSSPNRRYSPERGRSNYSNNESISTSGAHRHLKSTFSFHDNDYQTPQQNRPLSVRQSAVQRVGVGLPDF